MIWAWHRIVHNTTLSLKHLRPIGVSVLKSNFYNNKKSGLFALLIIVHNSKGALLPVLEWCSVGLFPFASQTPGDEKVVPALKQRVKGTGSRDRFKKL